LFNVLLRLHPNGEIDTTFRVDTSRGNEITCLKLTSEGKILVSGDLSPFSYRQGKGVVRLNSDGTIDESFKLDFVFDTCEYCLVRNILIQSDDKIVLIGSFTIENKKLSNHGIARLFSNGKLDRSFHFTNDNRLDYAVANAAIQPNGKIIIARIWSKGPKSHFMNPMNLVRLNTNGTIDKSFNHTTEFEVISKIHIQPDGKILFLDERWKSAGDPSYIVRLNANGSFDKLILKQPGIDRYIRDILFLDNKKLLVFGSFLLPVVTPVVLFLELLS
jgi:uncharacterized delta-60 repeat protein